MDPQPVLTQEGLHLSWTMAAIAVTGIAYIIRSELAGRQNRKDLTELKKDTEKQVTEQWKHINALRGVRKRDGSTQY